MAADNYWHELQPVPVKIRSELKKMVIGKKTAQFQPPCQPGINIFKVESGLFKEIFTVNRRYLYMGDYTAPPDENDYKNSACFVTEDGLAGFAITESGWLVSLFSNLETRGFLNLVSPIIKARATKLVCIVSGNYMESGLVKSYRNILGFVPYARTKNDARIMSEYYGGDFVENFQKFYGSPYHLFMVKPDTPIADDGLFVFDDYFEAEEFVDGSIR